MTKTEIRTAAKEIVAQHGSYLALEFGAPEFFSGWDDLTEAERDALVAETIKQAERVLDFLGL